MTHRVLHTQMIIKKRCCIARTTLLAVKIIFVTTNSTDPTIITMELSFCGIIIKEFANFAEIFPHIYTTVRANLSNWLFCVTNCTYNLFDIISIELMTIAEVLQHIRGLVVTVATSENLVATWSPNLAPSPVVLASVTHLSKIKTFIGNRSGFHELWRNG